MDDRTRKSLDFSLLVCCLIGGAAGGFLAEFLYNNVTESLPVFLRVGIYFGLIMFGICLGGIFSEATTKNLNAGRWKAADTGRSLLLALLFSAAAIAAGSLSQFIYGLGYKPKALTNIDDYIILIDNSGSTLGTDPQRERFSSVVNLASTLNPGQNLMVKVFEDNVTDTFPMSPASPDLGQKLSALFAGIQDGGGTNIQGVLLEAAAEYQPAAGRNAIVLLLSDGESYVDTKKVFDEYNTRNLPIYVVSFSGTGSGGSRLLQTLADGTDGYYYEINELSNLNQAVSNMIQLATQRNLLEPRRGSDRNNTLAMILRVVLVFLISILTGFLLSPVVNCSMMRGATLIIHLLCGLGAGIVLEVMISRMDKGLVRLVMAALLSVFFVIFEKVIRSRRGLGTSVSKKDSGFNSGYKGDELKRGSDPRSNEELTR